MSLQSIIFITNQKSTEDRLNDFVNSGIHPFELNSTDTTIIKTDTSVGIEQVREIKHFLSTKPLVENYKTCIIPQAEFLTTEAQNALLKTLEEPGLMVKIILIAPHTHTLLPTVISRCHVIKSSIDEIATDLTDANNLLNDLKSLTLGDKIILSDTYKDRGQAEELTNSLIQLLRQNLLTSPTKQNLYNLTLALYTNKILGQNANVKLAMDNLFIYLKF